MKLTLQALLPALRQFPPDEREEALQKASSTPLDLLELVGMASGMVAVTVLTRYAFPLHDPAVLSRVSSVIMDFALALPLLVVSIGPFHIRRLRRGLNAMLCERASR